LNQDLTAKEGDFWPSALELAGGDLQKFSQMPLDERLSYFGSNFFQALKKRPVTQAIMAWKRKMVKSIYKKNMRQVLFPNLCSG